MKSKFARVALVLVSGLIAGGAAFAQAAPEQTPPARMAGTDGDQKVNVMHAKRDKSMMGMHTRGSHAVSGTLNPRVRVY
jgi:hypothetical protein